MKTETIEDIKKAISKIEYHAAELNGFLADDVVSTQETHEELTRLRELVGDIDYLEDAMRGRNYTTASSLVVHLVDIIDERDSDLEDLESRVSSLDYDNDELRARVESYETQNEDLRSSLEEKDAEIEGLKAQVEELTDQLNSIAPGLNA